MRIPEDGKIFSVNEGNLNDMEAPVQEYIEHCKANKYSGRYIGSLVSDFHRNLIKGGIYLYPSTKSAPKGKLRLLYECSPLAFIIEQAGGLATDGENRVMEIRPEELHQRIPFFVGSKKMVEKAIELRNKD